MVMSATGNLKPTILQGGGYSVAAFSYSLVAKTREMILYASVEAYFYGYGGYFQTVYGCAIGFY